MIADEVTDKSTTEQISICVRFVGKDSNGELCLKESFVCFAEASSTSGEYIAQIIVDKFNEFGLVSDNLRARDMMVLETWQVGFLGSKHQ